MTTTRRFPRGLPKPKPAPNPREKKPPVAQVARRVGKATMAGMKRFNAFSYSQGDGKRRVFRIPLTFRFFILASFIIIFLMLLALNNQSVSVDEETIAIAGLPSALENYRILHISDLHAAEFGTEQSTLLRTVNNLDYDIMLITGDMVGARRERGALPQLFARAQHVPERVFHRGRFRSRAAALPNPRRGGHARSARAGRLGAGSH